MLWEIKGIEVAQHAVILGWLRQVLLVVSKPALMRNSYCFCCLWLTDWLAVPLSRWTRQSAAEGGK
jgi:hypothetical protein